MKPTESALQNGSHPLVRSSNSPQIKIAGRSTVQREALPLEQNFSTIFQGLRKSVSGSDHNSEIPDHSGNIARDQTPDASTDSHQFNMDDHESANNEAPVLAPPPTNELIEASHPINTAQSQDESPFKAHIPIPKTEQGEDEALGNNSAALLEDRPPYDPIKVSSPHAILSESSIEANPPFEGFQNKLQTPILEDKAQSSTAIHTRLFERTQTTVERTSKKTEITRSSDILRGGETVVIEANFPSYGMPPAQITASDQAASFLLETHSKERAPLPNPQTTPQTKPDSLVAATNANTSEPAAHTHAPLLSATPSLAQVEFKPTNPPISASKSHQISEPFATLPALSHLSAYPTPPAFSASPQIDRALHFSTAQPAQAHVESLLSHSQSEGQESGAAGETALHRIQNTSSNAAQVTASLPDKKTFENNKLNPISATSGAHIEAPRSATVFTPLPKPAKDQLPPIQPANPTQSPISPKSDALAAVPSEADSLVGVSSINSRQKTSKPTSALIPETKNLALDAFQKTGRASETMGSDRSTAHPNTYTEGWHHKEPTDLRHLAQTSTPSQTAPLTLHAAPISSLPLNTLKEPKAIAKQPQEEVTLAPALGSAKFQNISESAHTRIAPSAQSMPRPILHQIRSAALSISESRSQIEVSLSPEHLGKLNLKLDMQSGSVMILVTSEKPETYEFLKRHISEIQSDLAEHGFENLGFSLNSPKHHSAAKDRELQNQSDVTDDTATPISLRAANISAKDTGLDMRL